MNNPKIMLKCPKCGMRWQIASFEVPSGHLIMTSSCIDCECIATTEREDYREEFQRILDNLPF